MPNFKISQLTTATAVSATNQFEINQNAASRSLEVSVLSTYIRSGDSGKAIVVSVSTASDALRITQTGTGNALVVEDSANPDATPFVVNASGNVGIGTSSPAAKLEVDGVIRGRAASGEGGHLELNNPDNASVGAILDVSGANITRWFTVENNTQHQIGQLAGTGGTIALYTAAAERMRIDASGNVGIGTSSPGSLLTVNGNLAFNSGYGSAAVAYGCRAWVNFNGTGTVAIRASGNVTSITDNGTGQYTMNFTTALPDANYSAAAASFVAGTAIIVRTISFATTSLSLNTTNSAASDVDASTVSIAIFR